MKPTITIRSRTAEGLNSVVLFCVCMLGCAALNSARAQPASSSDQAPSARELRFAVAYLHGGSWGYGFLYGSDDKVRFEVVQPQSAKSFSFEAPRAEVLIRQWILLGTPQDAVELKFQGKTYHIRWLANPNEILTGGANRWTAPVARPPYALIAAMQNPSAALAQGQVQPATPPSNPQDLAALAPGADMNGTLPPAGPSPGGSMPSGDEDTQNIIPGRLAGVYVSTADSNLHPTNTQYIFYPDGLVMHGVPEEGMLNFDFNHYRAQDNPDRYGVGRYQLQGNFIKVVWINQLANPSIILRDENIAHSPASTGPQVFFPVCRCTGKQFSGVYHLNSGAANQYIQFFPDGAFIDHGVMDQIITPSRFFDHPRIQTGRYQIARQTILFAFADGHRAVRTFLAPRVQQGDPAFDWISLGRQMFFEANYELRIRQGR
jgi:hypothetical protein